MSRNKPLGSAAAVGGVVFAGDAFGGVCAEADVVAEGGEAGVPKFRLEFGRGAAAFGGVGQRGVP
jgi:hypothetical protein